MFVITPQLLTDFKAPLSMKILHPLPRVGELSPELDTDPRACYFKQMQCGLYVRMALLAIALGVAPIDKELAHSVNPTSVDESETTNREADHIAAQVNCLSTCT